MNIKRRIFLSYFVLVLLVIIYLGLMFLLRTFQSEINKDISEFYSAQEVWNNLLISINELQINWADGKTYNNLKKEYNKLEVSLMDISNGAHKNTFFITYDLNNRRKALYRTWSIAGESVKEIINTIESQDFRTIISKVQKQPGLQRLNKLWMDLYINNHVSDKKDMYLLKQVLDKIEFFPIYSDTLNHLFKVCINDADLVANDISSIGLWLSACFFVVFLLSYMILAIIFAESLSRPIIGLSVELSKFVGQTLKLESHHHDNELIILKDSVKNLMDHYIYLSELAEDLAIGNLTTPIVDLQNQGLIGNSLKNINIYLNELAETSNWIKNGNYGVKVRVKSDNDILAKNFNIMSGVIKEQITTLRNMFETVEESIVVINKRGEISELNTNFLQLTGYESDYFKEKEKNVLRNIFQEDIVSEFMAEDKNGTPCYTTILNSKKEHIPVKIIPRFLPENTGDSKRVMLFITNESIKYRAEREKKQLKAHAMEAELKALRAQINPHFLFNTLNGIAHLVESGSEKAVQMIEKLSEIFRYSLASTRKENVFLREEIEIIKQYMEIEKMRFGNNLLFNLYEEGDYGNNKIPPMLIQPIVENAVKYGRNNEGKIEVSIHITKNNGLLKIWIADKGLKVLDQNVLLSQNGTGIKNVNKRLVSLFNNQLQFFNNKPSGLKVLIEIPEEFGAQD